MLENPAFTTLHFVPTPVLLASDKSDAEPESCIAKREADSASSRAAKKPPVRLGLGMTIYVLQPKLAR
ncbi:MAG: hypothetical protein DMF40_09650 [Verrucomicrobia bacterium]|nr:MAG: hypothetical protein DMF40_09650 [Verrucomicrobiota bacterium]